MFILAEEERKRPQLWMMTRGPHVFCRLQDAVSHCRPQGRMIRGVIVKYLHAPTKYLAVVMPIVGKQVLKFFLYFRFAE
jgi:hypothetical protein